LRRTTSGKIDGCILRNGTASRKSSPEFFFQ
jgi:hypothetical protein